MFRKPEKPFKGVARNEGYGTGNIIEGRATEPDMSGCDITLTDGFSYFVNRVHNRETALTLLRALLRNEDLDWTHFEPTNTLTAERKNHLYENLYNTGIYKFVG